MSQEHNQNVINNDHIIRINFEDDEKIMTIIVIIKIGLTLMKIII
jgi:hypothetical protein